MTTSARPLPNSLTGWTIIQDKELQLLTVNRKSLAAAMTPVTTFTPENSVSPILGGVKISIDADNKVLVLLSSGVTAGETVLVESRCSEYEGEIEDFVVDAKELRTVVSSSSDEVLKFDLRDGKCVVTDSHGVFRLPLYDLKAFPPIRIEGFGELEYTLDLPADVLAGFIDWAMIAVDKDVAGQYLTNTLNIVVRGREMLFVGHNGRSMAGVKYQLEAEEVDGACCISSRSAVSVCRILGSATNSDCGIGWNTNCMVVELSGVTLRIPQIVTAVGKTASSQVTRVVSVYNQCDTLGDRTLTVDGHELHKLARRVGLLTDDLGKAQLSFADNQLTLESQSSTVSLGCEGDCSNIVARKFSLREIARIVASDSIRLSINAKPENPSFYPIVLHYPDNNIFAIQTCM